MPQCGNDRASPYGAGKYQAANSDPASGLGSPEGARKSGKLNGIVTGTLLLLILLVVPAAAQEAALAVVQKISGTVGFYTAEGKHLGDVKVDKHPHEAVLSPDKRFLYVTNNGILWMTDEGEGGNTISIVDVRSRTNVGTIDLGEYHRPHGIDLDPATGYLAVTIENPDGMILVDPASRKVLRKFDVQGGDPHMVLFGPKAEWAYVSNTATGTIAAVHVQTGETKLIPTDARPQGLLFSHDGRILYATNSEGNSISIIDAQKKERVGVIPVGNGAARVALTPDGKTLVYNLGLEDAMAFADIATRKQTTVVKLTGRPLSLTMSRDGKTAYAGIQDQDKVVVISVPDRKIKSVFATPKGSGPDPIIPLE